MTTVNHGAHVGGQSVPAGETTETTLSAVQDQPFEYAHYELLRDRQWNRELLAEHISYFGGCRKVLDLACGSGIFLELLAERGIPALGVERNARVVEWVRARGWEVVHQDVLEFLSQHPDTYDGIFCSHFLEHLPFDQVVQLIALISQRLESGGRLVLVIPNPESIRMQLFGFWRDPEHVRFYHPELIEAVCRHYGLQVIQTNRQEEPFAIPGLFLNSYTPAEGESIQEKNKGWLRQKICGPYMQLLRALRLVPKADIVALEKQLRREREAFQQAVAAWAEKTTWAVNRMWAWSDNAAIVCRRQEE